ncbi:MAG: hypothetical protein P8180_14655 [Gammaproteobacteria bacterium]
MIEHTVRDLLYFARLQIRQHLDLDACPHNEPVEKVAAETASGV